MSNILSNEQIEIIYDNYLILSISEIAKLANCPYHQIDNYIKEKSVSHLYNHCKIYRKQPLREIESFLVETKFSESELKILNELPYEVEKKRDNDFVHSKIERIKGKVYTIFQSRINYE
jgi:hypothetical protein